MPQPTAEKQAEWEKQEGEKDQEIRRKLDVILDRMFAALWEVYQTDPQDESRHKKQWRARSKAGYAWDDKLEIIVQKVALALFVLLGQEKHALATSSFVRTRCVKGCKRKLAGKKTLGLLIKRMISDEKKRAVKKGRGWLTEQELMDILEHSWRKLIRARKEIDTRSEELLQLMARLDDKTLLSAEDTLSRSGSVVNGLTSLPASSIVEICTYNSNLGPIVQVFEAYADDQEGLAASLKAIAQESTRKAVEKLLTADKQAPESFTSILEKSLVYFTEAGSAQLTEGVTSGNMAESMDGAATPSGHPCELAIPVSWPSM